VNDLPLLFGEAHRRGFRLERFEVYNWGTFHDRVWSIAPGGESALLTGEIGSGKSTLVDALTTMLVAPQKIAYNKAAGAETRERTLRSYVAGHYKSERGEVGLAARPVALRDRNAYSVILGRFRAEELGLCVTLAQVFWQREAQGQPERLYVVAERELTIGEHFGGFGGELRELRRRLRGLDAELHESFTSYGSAYRRRLGIADEQAMDLFHQTVSMKSVGNLTEFVREHMLQPFDVESRIKALTAHFADLHRAHQAVLTAKDQIERLTPLIADCDALVAVNAEIERLRSCREALRPWFAALKGELLERRIAQADAEIDRREREIAALELRRRAADGKRADLRAAVAANGGDRIAALSREIERLSHERAERERRRARYDELSRALDLPEALDEERFVANRVALERARATLDADEQRTQIELTEATVAERELRREGAELEEELVSLRSRRSNLPRTMLALRERLCTEIACAEDELPFAGELLMVRPEAREWEGAAERVLHGFALSLLVPDERYGQVAAWVDRTHLGGRIVYHRVRQADPRRTVSARPLEADSLVHRLAVSPESPFATWLDHELARRFDYACCEDLAQFRRAPRALTRAGQIKSSEERHEKDDRRRIDDRANYVLGWSNEAKIAVLEERIADLHARIATQARAIAEIERSRESSRLRRALLEQLAAVERFVDLDRASVVAALAALERERAALTATSDVLRTLEEELRASDREAEHLAAQATKQQREHSVAEEKRAQAGATLEECRSVLDAVPQEAQDRWFPELAEMRAAALGEHVLTIESCDAREREMREWLQGTVDAAVKRGERLRDGIVRAMQEFRGHYPTEAQELDAAIDAADAYRTVLARLHFDDLPRFEARFKELLNENAIREIANFHSQLNRELHTTAERIESINGSLREIDYNPGRYIVLSAEPSVDAEIRDFRRDLRACTESALTGSDDDAFAEAKFVQVKRIIERFRGRDGLAELDRRWTRKVTDVRNWQEFSASERWREDDREHEHYADSGGKSGGQKEKLAYTVLAASLAYQFGLGRGASRSFRFVVIDEAFGRGSEESARYGLELFKRLDLQLLVVTPLQKIHVIEPFVSAVAFVHHDGRESQLHNLTIEEFRAERAARNA